MSLVKKRSITFTLLSSPRDKFAELRFGVAEAMLEMESHPLL